MKQNGRGYAKHRLSKFKGIKKENFLLHLKECEFRYNTKTTQENLYQKLLKLIRGLISSNANRNSFVLNRALFATNKTHSL